MGYYHDVWGFDPDAARIPLDPTGTLYRYERGFSLDQDRFLEENGVMIWARVDVTPIAITNFLVLMCDGREALVRCVHTAVYDTGATEIQNPKIDRYMDSALSTEHTPVTLPPEEHFVSLLSYVGGIAEIGLVNMFQASYFTQEGRNLVIFGFNEIMQRKVIRALHHVLPAGISDFIREIPDADVRAFLHSQIAPNDLISLEFQVSDHLFGAYLTVPTLLGSSFQEIYEIIGRECNQPPDHLLLVNRGGEFIHENEKMWTVKEITERFGHKFKVIVP